MTGAQQGFQYRNESASGGRLLRGGRGWVLQNRLGQLQIPVAVIIPDEFIERPGGQVKAVGVKVSRHCFRHLAQSGEYPPIREVQVGQGGRTLGQFSSGHIQQYKAGRIPYFVAEISITLNPIEIKANIPPGAGQSRKAEAQRVGAVVWDPVGKLLSGGFFDLGLQMGLHQARGAFGNQAGQIYPVDDVQGSTILPLDLDILSPFSSRMSPVM